VQTLSSYLDDTEKARLAPFKGIAAQDLRHRFRAMRMMS